MAKIIYTDKLRPNASGGTEIEASVSLALAAGGTMGTSGKSYATKEYVDIGGKKTTTVTSAATVTPTGDGLENEVYITAQGEALTIANQSGTPANGNTLLIRIKDDGTARAITWGTGYYGFSEALPATTIAGKTLYVGGAYDSAKSKVSIVSIKYEI